jgi:hypothetical protein
MQWLQKHSELNFKHIIFKRDIDKFTEEYINYITKNYNNLKKNQSLIKTISPSEIRGDEWYDYLFEKLDETEEENNEDIKSVDIAIKHLDNAKNMLNEIKSIIQDIKLNINNKKVGTLQGISRQVIKENENNIIPDPIAQNVIDQPYNESEFINGGKKKKIRRTKKRKMNKRKNKSKRVNKKYK